MATLIDSNTVRVERGDTLSSIARKYGNGLSYTQLANINNIPDPNRIYVGQTIKLTPTTPSTPSSQPSSSTGSVGGTGTSVGIGDAIQRAPEPVVLGFGLQSDDTTSLFAIWSFNMPNFDKFETEWYYYTGNDLNNGSKVWFVGSKSTTEEFVSTYSIPSEALLVKFRVKGVSKTQKVNDMDVPYWTSNWSKEHVYDVSNNPPSAPSSPTVEVEGYTLTAYLDNLNDYTSSSGTSSSDSGWNVFTTKETSIEFQVVKNDSSIYKSSIVHINSTKYASFSCAIEAGDRYKVRCRAHKAGKTSNWSDYSSNVTTIPEAPADITICRANSETSVYLEWTAAKAATSYTIEYTTKKDYFDGSDATSTKSGITSTHFEITGIESGQEYFFRVKAVNDKGESSWSPIKSVLIGKPPAAPTTWSSSTTVTTGEKVTLYWVHNSSDSSSQTYAELEIYCNGNLETHTIKNSTDDDEKDKTSSFEIDTSKFTEGTTISWRVRTSGVTLAYGDWSVQRVINVYAPPTLQLSITDSNGPFQTLTSFPFYLSALAGPNTQAPIGYHVSVVSKSTYETSDGTGDTHIVSAGEEIYSKHFDIGSSLMVEFSADNINLENNVEYTITCTVSMNSGLISESSISFNVAWYESRYIPNAQISIDTNTLAAYIRPYCETSSWTYYKVEQVGNEYVKTEDVLEEIAGIPLENVPTVGVYTTTKEEVFYGKTKNNEDVIFCVVPNYYLVEGVTLSVYRREFDGSLVEVGKNLPNNRNVFVTDPHPALDLARYRIVAVENSTGAVSYSDLTGISVGEKSVVIQWDEKWSNFETNNEDAIEEPAWSGSMLKLPYNIDISDSHDGDVSLVKYAGRKNPVSYYGTQLGVASTWKVDISKSDKETIYAIRRLAIWQGDVYVREPSGTGYWASIKVSYDVNHCEVVVPVSFGITRVEGGL